MGKNKKINKYRKLLQQKLEKMGIKDEIKFKNTDKRIRIPVFHQEDIYETLPIIEKDANGNETVVETKTVIKHRKGDLVLEQVPNADDPTKVRVKEEVIFRQTAYNMQRNILKKLLLMIPSEIEAFLAADEGKNVESVSL